MSQAEIIEEQQEQEVQARKCEECFRLPAEEREKLAETCPVLATIAIRSMKPPTEEALLFMLSQPPDEPIALVPLKVALIELTSDRLTKEVAYTRMRSAKKVVDEEFGEGIIVVEGGHRHKTQRFRTDLLKSWCEDAPLPKPKEEQEPKPKPMKVPASFTDKEHLPGMRVLFFNYILKGSDDLWEGEEQDKAMAEIVQTAEVDPVLILLSIYKAMKDVTSDKHIDLYANNVGAQARFEFAAMLAKRATRNTKKED